MPLLLWNGLPLTVRNTFDVSSACKRLFLNRTKRARGGGGGGGGGGAGGGLLWLPPSLFGMFYAGQL